MDETPKCKCGCGQTPSRLKFNDAKTGKKAGEHHDFVHNHWHAFQRTLNPKHGDQYRRQISKRKPISPQLEQVRQFLKEVEERFEATKEQRNESERKRQRLKWHRDKEDPLFRKNRKEWRREQSRLLTDYYIRRLLAHYFKVSQQEITEEMIIVKRAHLILKRVGLSERRKHWRPYIKNRRPHYSMTIDQIGEVWK